VAGVAALTLLGAVCLSGTPVQKVASPGTTIAPPTTIATVEQPITDPTTTTPQPVAHAASTPAGAAYYCQPSTFSPASMVTQLATPNRPNGWLQIALNSRPNGSTAWVPSGDVQLTSTPYRIVISICQRTLTLYQGSNQVYAHQ
jgi:hypothetical protein